MRNPLRTEAEAFSFVLVVAILFLAVALAGVRYGGEVALVVFGSLVLGALVGIYLRSEPKAREPAVWERRRDERRRILVVANESLAAGALPKEIRERASGEAEVLVVVPDDDVLEAIDDALGTFDADEIVVSSDPGERSQRLGSDVVRLARERYARPVTHVVVELGG